MRAAVIFHRLGPYHVARLRAASRLMPIIAIETSGADETYAWDKITATEGFERVTLFPQDDAQKQPRKKVARRIASLLDDNGPQTVVVPGWSDSAALGAIQWCVKNQIPGVVMSESTEWDEQRSGWREAVKRRIIGLCSAALVGGNPHRDYMVELGMPPERVFLGYDAVDNDYFQENAETLKAETLKLNSRHKYGLPENYFLASARFIEKKNLFRLLEAYARYRDLVAKNDNGQRTTDNGRSVVDSPVVSWPLVLLGGGELRPTLSSQLSTLNLQHHVLLPGFKQYPDLPAYYGLAKAFIHASTTEQWGLVVNEAMASGLPVLVSNRCGCAQDLVQEGVNGFTFDPYNVEELANLMLKIAAFNFPLSAFGDASKRIVADWGPERFASGLKAAVDKALEVGPKKVGVFERLLLGALIRR